MNNVRFFHVTRSRLDIDIGVVRSEVGVARGWRHRARIRFRVGDDERHIIRRRPRRASSRDSRVENPRAAAQGVRVAIQSSPRTGASRQGHREHLRRRRMSENRARRRRRIRPISTPRTRSPPTSPPSETRRRRDLGSRLLLREPAVRPAGFAPARPRRGLAHGARRRGENPRHGLARHLQRGARGEPRGASRAGPGQEPLSRKTSRRDDQIRTRRPRPFAVAAGNGAVADDIVAELDDVLQSIVDRSEATTTAETTERQSEKKLELDFERCCSSRGCRRAAPTRPRSRPAEGLARPRRPARRRHPARRDAPQPPRVGRSHGT